MSQGDAAQEHPLTLSTILFPVDFSARARVAAGAVRLLAARFSSRVTLLHALPLPHYELGVGLPGDLFPGQTAAVEEELAAFAARELAGLECRQTVATGEPASVIVGYARRERVGLIVMPTHGLGAFRQFLLGSTTAKVLHDAECPVLTGVHAESPLPRIAARPLFRQVLCAVDLRPQSSRVFWWAASLAEAFGARFSVVHAVPPAPGPGSWNAERLRSARELIPSSAFIRCARPSLADLVR